MLRRGDYVLQQSVREGMPGMISAGGTGPLRCFGLRSHSGPASAAVVGSAAGAKSEPPDTQLQTTARASVEATVPSTAAAVVHQPVASERVHPLSPIPSSNAYMPRTNSQPVTC